VVRATDQVATANMHWDGSAPDPATSLAPYRLYNIGNSRPIELLRYIAVLEECLGKPAVRVLKPLQPGDVAETWADVAELSAAMGYRPETPVEVGVRRFVDWFR